MWWHRSALAGVSSPPDQVGAIAIVAFELKFELKFSTRPGVVRSTAGTARYRSDAKRHPFSGLVDSAGELLHTP